MSPARTSRLRLTAAVAAVLAVTTAGGLAAPASAAPATSVASVAPAAVQQDALTVPAGTSVVSSGPTGFLTFHLEGEQRVYTWTRHHDGSRTRLPGERYAANAGTDTVVRIVGTVHTYLDMSAATGTGTELVSFDTSTLGSGTGTAHRLLAAMGTTLVTSTVVDNARVVHLITKEQGVTVDRTIAGIPAGAGHRAVGHSDPHTLVVHYSVLTNGVRTNHVAVVDVATARVVETYDAAQTSDWSASDVSATHVAWIEWPTADTATLATVRRGTTEVTRTPLGHSVPFMTVKIVGDWVAYARTGGGTAAFADPLWSFTARSLSAPDRTVTLLDDVANAIGAPDGQVYATGGTVEHGKGVYRLAPGADGTPTATMVANTGVPTVLEVKDLASAPVPTSVDFARGQDASLFWEFSKATDYSLVVTHNVSGSRWTPEPVHLDRPSVGGATWTGMLDDRTSAPLGDYTWRLKAKPANGIGPVVERTGTIKVTAKPAPHDFTDSGAPDLLVRDSAGRLLAYDARQTLYETGAWGVPAERTSVVMGTGWQIYDRVTAPGNLDASPHADVIARDRSGVLWLHSGTGKGFAPRKQIGTGWGIYTLLTGGSDLTNDGRADLVATDRAGALWLYQGTGNANAPFAARKKIGTGWGIYNRIAGAGNLAGGPAGDLVARDAAGVLWLYLGKGDGTFAPRVKIGAGWDRYSDIVGVGDTNRDGRPDLVVQGLAGGAHDTLSVYKGTGDWRAPFATRTAVYNPEELGTGAVTLF
ncbi:FG-GAP repeat domain-containing protein [Streptomyces sp. NPDC003327]